MAVCRGGETTEDTQTARLLRPVLFNRSDEKRQVQGVFQRRGISCHGLLRHERWRRMDGRMIYLLTYLLTYLPTYLSASSFVCLLVYYLIIYLVIYLCIMYWCICVFVYLFKSVYLFVFFLLITEFIYFVYFIANHHIDTTILIYYLCLFVTWKFLTGASWDHSVWPKMTK